MTATQLLKFWILSFRYIISNRTFDVLHCHDLTGLPPAVWYKFFFPRIKIIYDSHEIYPEGVREKLGSLVAMPFLMLEKFCLKFVTKIIGISVSVTVEVSYTCTTSNLVKGIKVVSPDRKIVSRYYPIIVCITAVWNA